MKGTLVKSEQGWIVAFYSNESKYNSSVNTLPLHPDHIEMMETCFTSKFSREVEFEIVDEYAKLK
jgi:hypothetical protein